MGKSVHISENISKTQIVEMIFESIKKSSENQSNAIAEETLKKFSNDAEKVRKSEQPEKSSYSEKMDKDSPSKRDGGDNEEDESEQGSDKKRDRYGRFKTKGKHLDIKG